MSGVVLRVVSVLLSFAALAQSADLGSAERERIDFERARTSYEDAIRPILDPENEHATDGAVWMRATDRVLVLGDAALPFLGSELGSPDPLRRSFARYTLARFPGTEAQRLLEAYVEDLRDSTDRLGVLEKAWGCVALAAHGRIDALERMESGTPVSAVEYAFGVSSLDAAAILLGPPAREPLVRALSGIDPNTDAGRIRAVTALAALSEVPDASLVAVAERWLGHLSWPIRSSAVAILEAVGNAEAVHRLFPVAISDGDERPRLAAASAIEALRPPDAYDRILVALETVEDPFVRGAFYRTLAAIDPDRAVDALRSHRGRRDPNDRRLLLQALATTRSPKALNLLRDGLRDPDLTVALAATNGLADSGSAGAVDTLLALIRDPRRVVSQMSVERLASLGEARAAPRVADVLLRDVLASRATLRETRELAAIYTDALVKLRYAEPADELAAKAATIEDPELRDTVAGAAGVLREFRVRGADVDAWIAALGNSDPALRSVAYERLGEIGGPRVAAALGARFDAVPSERLEIVRTLAAVASPDSAPRFRRILENEEPDPLAGAELRLWAAWGLRRLGGPEAIDALRRAAGAKDGREFPPLAYFAALAGPAALPTLQAVRGPRMAWQEGPKGDEHALIQRAIRDLEAGRPVPYLDVEPRALAHAH